MTTNTSNALSVLDSQFSLSTVPRNSTSRRSTDSIQSLYEIEYIPGDQPLPETNLPLMNPYKVFSKPSSLIPRSISQLIKGSSQRVKEYVQSSKFSSCQIPATEEEHFVALNIPEDFPRKWKEAGYTHLHFGVIRLGLTLHARKGLPVTARIALLDSRLKQYQHACIGTVQTTLNAGTVFVTLFPNFNISLLDPNLLKALKVQIQIVGIPMQEQSIMATLHHQMIYRVQDHALDLSLPTSSDALYIEVSSASQVPHCVQIPRQISTDELKRLLPHSWITSYEKLHQNEQKPITTAEARFHARSDGTVEIQFASSSNISAPSAPPVFPTQFMLFEASYENVPISAFQQNGLPVYVFQDDDGHKYWDICCSCAKCLDFSDDDDDCSSKR